MGRSWQRNFNLWFQGIIFGELSTGNNFVTTGPDDIAMILRDPPGSGSSAYIEKGQSFTTTVVRGGQVLGVKDVGTTLKHGAKTSVMTGTAAGAFVATSTDIELTTDASASVRISEDVQKTGSIIYMMLYELYKIILKLSGADLAGPIGVAQMAGEVAEMGIVPLLNFTAFLSLNLGIINLFPIPALDGGHFAGLCIEAVMGRPVSPKMTYYAQRVGIALLLLLMIFATKNDIVRVFFGG